MKITLAHQTSDGAIQAERAFSQPVIFIGRDAGECDLSFDRDAFPMVSRKHAELSWENGRWVLTDAGSMFGTFVNGERLSSPRAIAPGDVLMFGNDGPTVRVASFDAPAEFVPQATPANAPLRQGYSERSDYGKTMQRHEKAAFLEFLNVPGRDRFAFTQGTIHLGRDHTCEVAFDASAATVSRKHAELHFNNGTCTIIDNNSFNGTLLNGQRITAETPVTEGDEIQLGLGGPIMRFSMRQETANAVPQHSAPVAEQSADRTKTMVFNLDKETVIPRQTAVGHPRLVRSAVFGPTGILTIGRDPVNDIQLDGLGISNRHAKLKSSGGRFTVEDLNSTNGVFLNGSRISSSAVAPEDSIQIGAFVFRVDAAGTVGVFDSRAQSRVDASKLVCIAGKTTILDGVSLVIPPNEFVGVLGPSGAGKSTLLEALNGMRPADSGSVRINDLDLYRHFDSLKQAVGYVPQDDIIHHELSVYRTLFYVAKLRLSKDVSRAEIRQLIDEVLDVTGLTDKRDLPVKKLSGGQRKRVSIAVELITKPSVIFLDEPTTGLDPSTEGKIMLLFRQIAESGHTVVMTTHAMENVRLFDKIVILMKGKLVFYGRPDEALAYFGAADFTSLYDIIESADAKPDELKARFENSRNFAGLIAQPLASATPAAAGSRAGKKLRLGIFGMIRQWFLLSRRYFEVLLKDKLNLFILIAQAPILALMTFVVTTSEQPRDFLYFVVAIVAVWFGTSVSAREIVRERPIYVRERMFNLGVLPYLFSKLTVLGIIVAVQCFLFFVPLKILDLAGLIFMPGELFGIPQFSAMLLTAAVGVSAGLFVSALVRTEEMATSLVPLILIPQLLFSGLAGVPNLPTKVASMAMPGAWSFDTIKRFSTLDTLEPEGAKHNGETKGLGLYEFIRSENKKSIDGSKQELEDLKKRAEEDFRSSESLDAPMLSDIPELSEPKELPKDLSRYVTFLHPWMNDVLNQIVLMLMFLVSAFWAAIVLRLRDIK
jgi:ABC-type multidrug transport system ATPase subunit/pSer/pThr/pTyr-binding forkhead associated (FHA) protein